MQGPALGLHLSGSTSRWAAVLGRPVAHSLSPALHRAAYRALGLDGWTYDAIDCAAEDVAAVVAGAGPQCAGFSVTMPGKRAAFAVAARRTDGAELVGAANTLLPGPHGWTAANTDVDGVVGALAAYRTEVTDRDVVLLGAGGTAQAALVAAQRMGARDVHALVRDPARAGELRATAARAGIALNVHTVGSAAADRQLARVHVLISTLPPHAADPLAERTWSDRVVVLDAVYAGGPTPLARAVTRAGGRAVGGVEMLVHQAGAQVRLMTGRAAPLDAMRAALIPAAG